MEQSKGQTFIKDEPIKTARIVSIEARKLTGETDAVQEARANFIEWLSDINAQMAEGNYLGAFEELQKPDISEHVKDEQNLVRARWQRAAFTRASKLADTPWRWKNELEEAQQLVRNIKTWSLPAGITKTELKGLTDKLTEWQSKLDAKRNALNVKNDNNVTHLFENLDDETQLEQNKIYDAQLQELMTEKFQFQIVPLPPNIPPDKIADYDVRVLWNRRRALQLEAQLKKADRALQALLEQLGNKPSELQTNTSALSESLKKVEEINQEFSQAAKELGETNFAFDLDALEKLNEKLPEATTQVRSVTTELNNLKAELTLINPDDNSAAAIPAQAFPIALATISAQLVRLKNESASLNTEAGNLRKAHNEARELLKEELSKAIKMENHTFLQNLLLHNVAAGRQQIRRLNEAGLYQAEQHLNRATTLLGNPNPPSEWPPVVELKHEVDWFKRVKSNVLIGQFRTAFESKQSENARRFLEQLKQQEQDELNILQEILDAKLSGQASDSAPATRQQLDKIEERLAGLDQAVATFNAYIVRQAENEQRWVINQTVQKITTSLANLKVKGAHEQLNAALAESEQLLKAHAQYPALQEWHELADALAAVKSKLSVAGWHKNLKTLAIAVIIHQRLLMTDPKAVSAAPQAE